MIKNFVYKGCFIDQVDKNTFNHGGIVAASSYADAMAKLEKYYGSELIMRIDELMEIYDDPIVLTYEIVDNIVNKGYVVYEENM